MTKLIFKVFLISFVIFGAILFNGQRVMAATPYDDVIQLTEFLEASDVDSGPEWDNIDYTYDWYSEARDALYIQCHEYQQYCDAWEDLAGLDFENDNWLVRQDEAPDGRKYYTLFWTNDWDAQTSLNVNGDFVILNPEPSTYYYYSFNFANDPGYARSTPKGTYGFNSIPTTTFVLGEAKDYPHLYGTFKILVSTFNFIPPENYEGSIPPAIQPTPEDPDYILPEYTWVVSDSGELSVKYIGNLDYFLTGTSWLVIEKMTTNWEALDENLDSIVVQPAGSLDEKYQLPAAGYYMLRIDHNQQLDSPPWPLDHGLTVEQVWIQFYWNGSSPVSGDNIGGCDGICNNQTQHNNKILRAIEEAQFTDGGLQGLIFAPINAIALLPTLGDSCSPIVFPLLDEDVSMQCIRPMVQASPLGPVYATISVIITGLITWWVALKTFALIKGLQDPDDDKVEVLKL